MKYYDSRMAYLKSLLGDKCARCESKSDLEFDHIDKDTKSFTIGKKWSHSLDLLIEEIKKCQLLCKKCHKEKNKIDNGESVHGKYSYYRHHNCRCDSCRGAYNSLRKIWRKNKKSGK